MTVSEGNAVVSDGADFTVEAFFNTLTAGQLVTEGEGRNVQVYLGQVWDEIGNRTVPLLFNMRNMLHTRLTVSLDSMNREGVGWREVMEDNGTEYSAIPSGVVRVLVRFCETNDELRKTQRDLWEANDKLWVQQSDWEMLNAHLNDYAVEQGMCRDYERKLDSWNDTFTSLKLKGRREEYNVGITLPDLIEGHVWVTVEAHSPTEANELVSKMSTAEILRRVIEREGDCADELPFKAQTVSVVSAAE